MAITNWPSIIVEAGFAANTPVGGSGLLILDDPTYGQLDSGELSDDTTWSDISGYVKSFTVTRPSSRQQGPLWNYQAGTFSAVLDNSDGVFDPDNLNGPYVSDGVSLISTMVPIRVTAAIGSASYPLFHGFADSWNPEDVASYTDYTTINLSATDAFKVLAGIQLAAISSTGAGDTSGARIRYLLEQAGWYNSAEWLVIDDGDITVQGTTLGADALSIMQNTATAEIGQLYCSGAGAVVFRSRSSLLTDARSSTIQAVFGDSPGTSHDDGTELYCAVISRALDDTTIANDVQATRSGGTLQQVQDDTSIAKYLFSRSFSQSDLILETDTDALTWARWVLYVSKDDENRFDSIKVDPLADTDNLWPEVLGREIGDRIQAWARPPSVDDPITKDCFITGITHAYDGPSSSWQTTWTLQDASKYGSFLILDDATYGRLDYNALT